MKKVIFGWVLAVSTTVANQRKWIRSIRLLGDKWLLAKTIERKQNGVH